MKIVPRFRIYNIPLTSSGVLVLPRVYVCKPSPYSISCVRKLWLVRTRDRGPGGISSEDFPSQARSAFLFNAIVLSLLDGEAPRPRPSTFQPISQELTINANRKSGTSIT